MTKNNWKEEFDKEFQNREIIGDRTFREYCKYIYTDIQDFIQSLLDKQKEEIIKQLDTLIAPDCIDDSCEYIHEGYFKAVEEIINKIKEM